MNIQQNIREIQLIKGLAQKEILSGEPLTIRILIDKLKKVGIDESTSYRILVTMLKETSEENQEVIISLILEENENVYETQLVKGLIQKEILLGEPIKIRKIIKKLTSIDIGLDEENSYKLLGELLEGTSEENQETIIKMLLDTPQIIERGIQKTKK